MPRNIEIKARVGNLNALREKVAAIADDGPAVMDQDDTFFQCAAGRLKLRRLSPTDGELIYYERADHTAPRESRYSRTPTHDPAGLTAILAAAFGVRAVVRKRRELYLAGHTRIHLDRVDGLGDFLELEVVLRDEQSVAEGVEVARRLMRQLEIAEGALVGRAYVDLL